MILLLLLTWPQQAEGPVGARAWTAVRLVPSPNPLGLSELTQRIDPLIQGKAEALARFPAHALRHGQPIGLHRDCLIMGLLGYYVGLGLDVCPFLTGYASVLGHGDSEHGVDIFILSPPGTSWIPQ